MQRGQVLRLEFDNSIIDATGFVSDIDDVSATTIHVAGLKKGETQKLVRSNITSVTEVLSCPMFYRIQEKVKGEISKQPTENIKWTMVSKADGVQSKHLEVGQKPRLLFKVPPNEQYKRAWHFFKLFPKEEFEFCTNVAISDGWEEGVLPQFDSVAFFAAYFSSRNFRLSSKDGYRKEPRWLNHTFDGQSFSKLPQDIYEGWHAALRGYLPMDRSNFQESLLAARDREYAVCRIKPKLLENIRNSREAPTIFVCDELNVPYTGHMSGAKKRLQKKTAEGLEYVCLCTTNKDYEGYRPEVREPPEDGEEKAQIIQKADPVSGGIMLAYKMDGGPKYEIDMSSPSNLFGKMILLIF